MHRPTLISILWLFARTSVRRVLNRSGSLSWRRKPDSPSAAAPRTATRRRGAKSSIGGRLGGGLIACIMILGMVLISSVGIMAVIERIWLQDIPTQEVIAVSAYDYELLRDAFQNAESSGLTAAVDEMLSAGSVSRSNESLIPAAREATLRQFEVRGLNGFQVASGRWRGFLALLSDSSRRQALRAIGLCLMLVNGALVCLGVTMSSRDLSRTDETLGWLFQFPVPRRALFIARLAEYAVDNSAPIVAASLSGILLWQCGFSFGNGLSAAILLAAGVALGGAALRLLLDVWMMQHLSRRVRGAVMGAVTGIGSVGLFVVLGCGTADVITRGIVASADFLPEWLFWNPLALGFGADGLARAPGSLWWTAAPACAGLVCVIAVEFSSRATAQGLAAPAESSGNLRGAAPDTRRWSGPFHGLVAKELLQLRRQPEQMLKILLAPVFIGFLLYLNNPEQSLRLATHDAPVMCATVFSVCAYLLLTAGAAVIMSELRTLWFLQSQPRSLADCFRTKARVWSVIAGLVCLSLIGWAAAARPAIRSELLVRLPFLLAYVWFLGEIVFGLFSLGADLASEGSLRFRRTTWLLPVLLTALFSSAVYRGDVWSGSVLLVVLILLSIAVRQRQQAELIWLSEPVENPPRRLFAMHGLLALLGFLFLRDTSQAILIHTGISDSNVVAGAYCGSALIIAVSFLTWLRCTGLHVLPVSGLRQAA